MTTVVIGNIPPPVDGAGMVTARAVGIMQNKLDLCVEVYDPFDSKNRRMREILVYIKAAARLARPDVGAVYVQGVQGERMVFVLLLLVVARISGTLVIHHHHAFKFIDSPSLFWRAICSRFFKVKHIVLSEGMGQGLESRYRNSNWCVVGNAAFVRSDFLGSQESTSEADGNGPLVLFAGVAGIGKGEDILVDAVRRVRENTGQPIKLVLAGRGHTRTDDFVEVTGVLAPGQLAKRMQQASVFALPSSYAPEAAPMVIYEAAACGLVSIATSRGCIPEISEELNGAVKLVEPDVGSVADCLSKLLRSREEGVAKAYLQARESALRELSTALGSMV